VCLNQKLRLFTIGRFLLTQGTPRNLKISSFISGKFHNYLRWKYWIGAIIGHSDWGLIGIEEGEDWASENFNVGGWYPKAISI